MVKPSPEYEYGIELCRFPLTITIVYDDTHYETYAEGEEIGNMIFYFGTDDQVNIGSGPSGTTINMRGLCWASFENCLLGNYPTAPTMSFVIGKYPTFSGFNNPNPRVNVVNYNPAHAFYYLLTVSGGMSPSFIDTNSLSTVADTLFAEGLGVSFRMSGNPKVFSYVESILQHIDASMVYKPDVNGAPKFHFKLLRSDESISNLPIISKDNLLTEPSLTRRSWIETYNEIKAKHYDVVGEMFGINTVMTCNAIGAGSAEVSGYSFDLQTWTEGGFADDYTHVPNGLAFIDDIELYISVGSGTGSIQTSPDGIDWTFRFHSMTDGKWFLSVGGGDGSNRVMAGGASSTHAGILGTSVLGATWEDLTGNLPSPTGQIWAVVYDSEHSLWIIGSVGNYGRARILTSDDNGSSWDTQWTSGTAVWEGPNAGAYYDGTTILVGFQGNTWRSTNGTTWSVVNCGYNYILTSVACKNGTWVAVGYDGGTPHMFTSIDEGLSWTLLTQPSGMSIMNDVFSDGILFFAVGHDAQIWKSSNGTVWYEIDHGLYDYTYDFSRIAKRMG